MIGLCASGPGRPLLQLVLVPCRDHQNDTQQPGRHVGPLQPESKAFQVVGGGINRINLPVYCCTVVVPLVLVAGSNSARPEGPFLAAGKLSKWLAAPGATTP